MSAKMAYIRKNVELPHLPREVWMTIIDLLVATELTNADFLISCTFNKILSLEEQLHQLQRSLKYRRQIAAVCKAWYGLAYLHLFEYLIVKNEKDVRQLEDLFQNSSTSSAFPPHEDSFNVRNLPARLDIDMRGNMIDHNFLLKMIPTFKLNLKIVIIHLPKTYRVYRLPPYWFGDLLDACGQSIEFFDWTHGLGMFTNIDRHGQFQMNINLPEFYKLAPSLRILRTTQASLINFNDRDSVESLEFPTMPSVTTIDFDFDLGSASGWLSGIFRSPSDRNQRCPKFPALSQLIHHHWIIPSSLSFFLQCNGHTLTTISLNILFSSELPNALDIVSKFCPRITFITLSFHNWGSFTKDKELPKTVKRLDLHCVLKQANNTSYWGLLESLKTLKADGLTEIRFDSRNAIDIRDRHRTVWQQIESACASKKRKLGILELSSLSTM